MPAHAGTTPRREVKGSPPNGYQKHIHGMGLQAKGGKAGQMTERDFFWAIAALHVCQCVPSLHRRPTQLARTVDWKTERGSD